MKYPLIVAVLSTAVLLTGLSLAGMNNIYALQDQDVLTTPCLSRVFTGINDGIYPWDIFDSTAREESRAQAEKQQEKEEKMRASAQSEELEETLEAFSGDNAENILTKEGNIESGTDSFAADAIIPAPSPMSSSAPTETPTPTSTLTPTTTPTPAYTPRYAPLRESTYDEYINHVSADIYGEAGVEFAATYDFKKVDISYFDDALFIGDSRTVGLKKYTDLSEHADFLCETSMSVQKVLTSDFKGSGTLEDYLKKNDYGKVYLMLGINELGTGTTEDYMAKYTEVVDQIHEWEPEAKIIIQASMNIDKTQSDSDTVFNNTNLLGRNRAIATLADNVTFFYIDVNEVVCDEDGYLKEELRGDHLHLMGSSNEIWKEFLLSHGV